MTPLLEMKISNFLVNAKGYFHVTVPLKESMLTVVDASTIRWNSGHKMHCGVGGGVQMYYTFFLGYGTWRFDCSLVANLTLAGEFTLKG